MKELRLAGINEIESANALLTESYLDTVNKRFSKLPIDPIDAHVPLLPTQSLADILCRKEPRNEPVRRRTPSRHDRRGHFKRVLTVRYGPPLTTKARTPIL